MSDLVVNPNCWFSDAMAQIIKIKEMYHVCKLYMSDQKLFLFAAEIVSFSSYSFSLLITNHFVHDLVGVPIQIH